MYTLKELAQKHGLEIRHINTPLSTDESFEKVITPFELSNNNGGSLDAFKYYNDYYLYQLTK